MLDDGGGRRGPLGGGTPPEQPPCRPLLLRPPTCPPMQRTSRCLWSTLSAPTAASAASPSTGPPSMSRVGGRVLLLLLLLQWQGRDRGQGAGPTHPVAVLRGGEGARCCQADRSRLSSSLPSSSPTPQRVAPSQASPALRGTSTASSRPATSPSSIPAGASCCTCCRRTAGRTRPSRRCPVGVVGAVEFRWDAATHPSQLRHTH